MRVNHSKFITMWGEAIVRFAIRTVSVGGRWVGKSTLKNARSKLLMCKPLGATW